MTDDSPRPDQVGSPAFTALVAGQVGAILADRLGTIALIELISEATSRFAEAGSTFELSKMALAMTLPALLLGPLAGALVDRIGRKRALVGSVLARAAVVLAIPLLYPALPIWTVYASVAVLYLAGLFFLPARCAVVPEMVAGPALLRANSVLTVAATVATIAGFGAGGILVTGLGWQTAMAVGGGILLLSAALLARLRPRQSWVRSGDRRLSYPLAIRAAWREMRRSAAATTGVLVPPLVTGAGMIAYVLGVPLIERTAERGTLSVGVLSAAAGAGMALGGYLTGVVLGPARRETVAVAAGAASLAALAGLGLAGRPETMAAAVILAGLAAGPVFVASETAVQERTSPARQATVFAFRDALMRLVGAGAAVAAPAAAVALSVPTAMAVLPLALIPALAAIGLLTRRPPGLTPD
jgi:predicted MFS family arabinose efflux permease